MQPTISRRKFVGTTAAGAALCSVHTSLAAQPKRSALDKLTVGVMGVNGRGSALAKGFAQQSDVEIAAICDVDSRAIGKGVGSVKPYQEKAPQTESDFRRLLDDKSIDILVVAAPNHWHAPATILGCDAGKHVYVEKPCSHTPEEGELAVKAARRNDRVVTMGTQRRSRQILVEGIEQLHSGKIGNVLYSRTWYNNRRGPIGTGKETPVPEWLDYDLWQGPCVRKNYKDNLLHYNWHWHWHWGNGELGNNGVHALDVARWGLDVDYPTRVCSAGGRYRFEDDQETADTHVVTYEFGKKMISWEGLSWSPYGINGSSFGITFHGDAGSMYMFDTGYQIFDMQRKTIVDKSGSGGDAEHFDNFLGCIRNGGRPNADISEGHQSTLLCHLGNIALRTQSSLNTNPKNGHIIGNEKAASLWSKDYADGWKPA